MCYFLCVNLITSLYFVIFYFFANHPSLRFISKLCKMKRRQDDGDLVSTKMKRRQDFNDKVSSGVKRRQDNGDEVPARLKRRQESSDEVLNIFYLNSSLGSI